MTTGGTRPSPGIEKIVGLAMSDDRLRQRLIDDPESVIREQGIELTPDEMQSIAGSSREEREQMLQPLASRASPATIRVHAWSVTVSW